MFNTRHFRRGFTEGLIIAAAVLAVAPVVDIGSSDVQELIILAGGGLLLSTIYELVIMLLRRRASIRTGR